MRLRLDLLEAVRTRGNPPEIRLKIATFQNLWNLRTSILFSNIPPLCRKRPLSQPLMQSFLKFLQKTFLVKCGAKKHFWCVWVEVVGDGKLAWNLYGMVHKSLTIKDLRIFGRCVFGLSRWQSTTYEGQYHTKSNGIRKGQKQAINSNSSIMFFLVKKCFLVVKPINWG